MTSALAAAVLVACGGHPDPSGAAASSGVADTALVYAVSATVDRGTPGLLRVAVSASNPGRVARQISFGDCPVRVRLIRPEGVRAAWDSRVARPDCTLQLHRPEILPGQTMSPEPFRMAVTLDFVLADSVPPGHYRVASELELLRDTEGGGLEPFTVALPETTVRLPTP